MNVLIVYATKNGASREAAQMLANDLQKRASVSVIDVNNTPPSPEGFDVVVLGGSIRWGKLNSKLKRYIKENKNAIAQVNSAAFICCGLADDFDDYRIMQLPKDLDFSLGVHFFGGHLKPDRAKGFDKVFVKIMRESILTQNPDKSDCYRHELPELMPDTIHALAERILRLI